MARQIIQARTLKGFRDSLPLEELVKSQLRHKLELGFQAYGFMPIDTPSLEYSEILLGKAGGETEKQIYRFLDNGNRDVALRFDLTVPFARFMSQNKEQLPLPFKRYHIGKVWRGENTQRGRFREFYQCDFDSVGVDSPASDFEILLIAKEALNKIGSQRSTIALNHRGLLYKLLSSAGLAEKEFPKILQIVDKYHKIGLEQTEQLLSECLSSASLNSLMNFIQIGGDFSSIISQIETMLGRTTAGDRLIAIYQLIEELELEKFFKLDTTITRGLDYYTGVVFETYLHELSEIGSICSGGRYNNLTGLYSKTSLAGVGGSIGFDRLLQAMELINKRANRLVQKTVLLVCEKEELLGAYNKIARKIRAENINCEVYLESKSRGVQFQYAETKLYKYALICNFKGSEHLSFDLKLIESRKLLKGLSFPELLRKIE